MKTPPTYQEVYTLTTDEAEELAAAMRDKGYRAQRDFTGTCSTTPTGEHVHYSGVVVHLTPAQARRLAGIKAATA